MKYIVLLMALINIPFFPNTMNVFSCGFSSGIFVVMLINDSGLTQRAADWLESREK